MRAKTRLAHSMAALGVVVAVTACGNVNSQDDTAAPVAAGCRTGGLKWSLVLQSDKSGSRRDAHLTASNRGAEPCVFAGYPRPPHPQRQGQQHRRSRPGPARGHHPAQGGEADGGPPVHPQRYGGRRLLLRP